MSRRQIGYLAIGAWILLWSASVILGALRPSYSPVVNTLSELGAIGTPHALLWNVFGFGIPGALLARAGAGIARAVNPEPSLARTLATVLLILTGLAIIGQGAIPAEMTNGVADITSASTRGHFVSSLVSGVAWAVGALMLVGPMGRSPEWRNLRIPSAALVVLTLGAGLALRGVLPDGLAQRTGNAFFCAWYLLISLRLLSLGKAGRSS